MINETEVYFSLDMNLEEVRILKSIDCVDAMVKDTFFVDLLKWGTTM